MINIKVLANHKNIFYFRILTWALITFICIGVFIWNLSFRLSIFQQTCSDVTNCIDPGQLLLEDELALNEYGFSAKHYGVFRMLIDLVQGGAIFGIAMIIFLKKFRSWFAMFVSVSIMSSGTVMTLKNLQVAYPSMGNLFNVIVFLAAGYVVFFYIFPNGKFVPRWTIYVAGLWMVFTIGRVLLKGTFIDPFTWKPIWNYSGWIAFHVVALVAQIYRYKYVSNQKEQQQTKWFLFGMAAMVIGIIGESILDYVQHLLSPGTPRVVINIITKILLGFCFMGIPISIAIAMHDHRLWDIDYLISRTSLYGLLSAAVMVIYVAIVGSLSVLFQSGGNFFSAIIASAVVAIVFQPIRLQLQRVIDRVLYGERDNPYLVLTQMGQRLEASMAPNEILPAAAQTLAQALKLPYVAISIEKDGEEKVAAHFGELQHPLIRIPLNYQSKLVGTLMLSTRSMEEKFSRSEHKLLSDLAPQLGIAINNVRLTTDLQLARKKLVNAREEERKRLRRDLHDSLGPELAGLSMQMEAAKNFLQQDPEKVSTLLTTMSLKMKATIEDIREIVYSLRPPILDEFGLIYAIKEQVEKLRRAGNTINIEIDASETLPELPAAVEAAAFRIVQEALTNVIKHSEAKNCLVRIWLDRDFHLEVTDDGIGLYGERKGIGFSSMKERAEELGGFCTISNQRGSGTRVHAKIPMLEVESRETN